ncbi:MAG: hypothetical protein PWQ68_248, partial [Thermoanaerobacteraceae bacterium]|nr:hypothetical protein [Thermoanaerobacteraceae bacterium]
MVITQPKTFSEILQFLEGKKNIFITGCSLCATSCMTGGEKEI